MKIQEIMSSDVVTVAEETPLKEVAEVLAERRISGVPVVDADDVVVGIVSEADILFKERGPSSRSGVFGWLLDRYGFEGQLKLEATTAGEAMRRPGADDRAAAPARRGRAADARPARQPAPGRRPGAPRRDRHPRRSRARVRSP